MKYSGPEDVMSRAAGSNKEKFPVRTVRREKLSFLLFVRKLCDEKSISCYEID